MDTKVCEIGFHCSVTLNFEAGKLSSSIKGQIHTLDLIPPWNYNSWNLVDSKSLHLQYSVTNLSSHKMILKFLISSINQNPFSF